MKAQNKYLFVAALCLVLQLVVSPLCLAQSFRIATVGENTINMLLIQKQGDSTKQFIAKLKGSITGNVSGKIESLDGRIQSLESMDGNTSKVAKSELKDGTVIITTEDGQTFVIYDLNSNLVGKIRTGETSAIATTAASAAKPRSSSGSVLKEGGTAYVRVKQYSPQSGEPTVQEASGANGYTVRQLNTGLAVVATIAKTTGKEPAFAFGEAITLIEKKASTPAMWLVEKGQSKTWIPAYILTPNKAEIDFLKEKDRIPESMSYVYDNDGWKIWGMEIGGIGNSFVIDSHGLSVMAFDEGTSPFALQGNAVLFDESTSTANWKTPPVFDRVKTPFKLSPSCMYYCVSEGDKPAFECVDIAQQAVQKTAEAKTRDIGEMKRLLDQGADVNARREHGQTALANAAIDGDIKMVEFLLTRKADVNLRDKDGTTPLCFACAKGHVEIVKALLAKGADVKLAGTGNSSPLHLASSIGSLEIVKLLVKHGADVNASRKDGVTPLIHAAQDGYADVLGFLLASGSNPNAKENSEGLTALIIASQAGDTNIVQALLDNKANADAQDDYGWTPLMKAALKGHTDVAKLLLNKGAQVNLPAKQGETALYLACQQGNTDIVKLLLENKAMVDTKRSDGVTSLIVAAYKGHTEIVKLLLQNGADTKATTVRGYTALDMAKKDEIKQLLSK